MVHSSQMHRFRGAIILVIVLGLTGCSRQDTLYDGLTQTEANEMLSLMYAAGLPANKLTGQDDTYAVTTPANAFPEAMALLQANGLPREQFESMGQIFQKKGFVSSTLEERARLNFALSQELAHTISSIDGVIMARVHLVTPERQRLADSREPASASVFIKHRVDTDLAESVGKIKSVVINGVENLPYENVTVAFFAAEPYQSGTAAQPFHNDPVDRRMQVPILASFGQPGPVWFVLPAVIAIIAGGLFLMRSGKLRYKGPGAYQGKSDER